MDLRDEDFPFAFENQMTSEKVISSYSSFIQRISSFFHKADVPYVYYVLGIQILVVGFTWNRTIFMKCSHFKIKMGKSYQQINEFFHHFLMSSIASDTYILPFSLLHGSLTPEGRGLMKISIRIECSKSIASLHIVYLWIFTNSSFHLLREETSLMMTETDTDLSLSPILPQSLILSIVLLIDAFIYYFISCDVFIMYFYLNSLSNE